MKPAGGRAAAALACAALAFAQFALAGCGRHASAPAHRDVAALPGPCLLLTAPHAKGAFVADPGAQVQAPLCEIHVDSDQMFYAAVLNAGSRLDTAAVCVAGDIDRHGGLVTEPRRLCSANIDHFHRPPPPEAAAPCGPAPDTGTDGVVTMRPGVYCGGHAFSTGARVTFAPGVYVVRGGNWTFGAGDYVGRGVSFYFADASRPVFGQGTGVDLSPPVSGPRAGVLMDEARDLPPGDLVVGAADLKLDGLIHLPSRRAIFGDGSRLRGGRVLMVFDTAVLNATRWTLAGPWRP